MVALEQLVYGLRPDGSQGRGILATSPGISDSCEQEIVRLCEGWGAVPAEGLRRTVLLSFPLVTCLPSMPGDLHTVIQISQGAQPLFHAVVLTRQDFREFDLNPYSLVHEGVFVDEWTPGSELPRRHTAAQSLAPLVSPPPCHADVGSIDEAVRQVLVNQRLLLPLEQPSNDSDRFMALTVACLPHSLRQELRFASWAPSGTNRYSLAATCREYAMFTSWQPFLMTSVLGPLDAAAEDYVSDIQYRLRSGDLAGLEQLSRETRIVVGRSLESSRPRIQTVAATVDTRGSRRVVKGGPKVVTPGRIASTTRRVDADQPFSRSRPYRRPRYRDAGTARRRFSIFLSVAIMAAGAYYLWTAGHWTRLPGFASLGTTTHTQTDAGVVDVAAVYRVALGGLQKGSFGGRQLGHDTQRQRGLDMLRQAGQLLDVQSAGYLVEADQTLSATTRAGVKPAPPDRLAARGAALASELRRLALARVSLRDGIDWRDLGGLDSRTLVARYDSLVARRPISVVAEPERDAVDLMLRKLDVATRHVGGLSRLQSVLGERHWKQGWATRIDDAVDALGSVSPAYARQWREDARVMARLKRAEHRSNVRACAYAEAYVGDAAITAAVRDILPSLYARVASQRKSPPSALLTSTVEAYRIFHDASHEELAASQLEPLVERLVENRAVAFDPAVFDDHVDRIRFELMARQTADIAAPGQESESQLFMQTLATENDPSRWGIYATMLDDPFLVRWAGHRSRVLRMAQRERESSFTSDLVELAARRVTLLSTAGAGGACADLWMDLSRRTTAILRDYRRDDAPDLWPKLGELANSLTTPPDLILSGVTVRLDESYPDPPDAVVVELWAGSVVALRSNPVQLGPSAPAGTGWVGTTACDGTLSLAVGTPLTVRVVQARDGLELGRVNCAGWLGDWKPVDLGRLDTAAGVRIAFANPQPYWDNLDLPYLSP